LPKNMNTWDFNPCQLINFFFYRVSNTVSLMVGLPRQCSSHLSCDRPVESDSHKTFGFSARKSCCNKRLGISDDNDRMLVTSAGSCPPSLSSLVPVLWPSVSCSCPYPSCRLCRPLHDPFCFPTRSSKSDVLAAALQARLGCPGSPVGPLGDQRADGAKRHFPIANNLTGRPDA
jgi:hypothetical protein